MIKFLVTFFVLMNLAIAAIGVCNPDDFYIFQDIVAEIGDDDPLVPVNPRPTIVSKVYNMNPKCDYINVQLHCQGYYNDLGPDDPSKLKRSPDGRRCLVGQGGVIKANQVEAVVWRYKWKPRLMFGFYVVDCTQVCKP
ncbi:hypothetical protein POM88_038651 [Heracleum sosnowskyi]|uniref:Uncharacterized protein n=1 Tax=Heracleum sosnowskyi TaxID=360622 RepID=A0AAD8M5P2_9APIA|nr:hypothetical protein POM88_038651 [Heracleum sosnowskyi]